MKAASARPGNLPEKQPASIQLAPSGNLQQQLKIQLATASLLVLVAGLAVFPRHEQLAETSVLPQMLATTLVLWVTICSLLWRGLSYHGHERLGPANTLTLYRAAGTALLAGWIPAASMLPQSVFWVLSLTAVFLLALDGLDGFLARRTGLSSDLGARFDMETDALLTLVISVLLWQSGEVGLWILSLGLMRYVFVLAGLKLDALRQPLFPSFRRKLICVVQLASLCAMLSPLVSPPWSSTLGIVACLLLTASFARDTHWLINNQP